MKTFLTKTISVVLVLVMICGIVPMMKVETDAADINAIKQKIVDTYNTCRARNGGASFNGWCGKFVAYELYALGIADYGGGWNGNQWWNAIPDGGKTNGYTVKKYSGGSALNTLINNHGTELYNIVMCYPQQYGYSSSNPGAGHVMFIYAIVNNTVYFTESYTTGSEVEGTAISMSVSAFNSRYNSWYGNAQGCIWYSNSVVSTTGISLNTNYSTVDIGESVKLTATVSPSNATNKTVTWTSNDTSVATVSGGTVTGIKPGAVTITAKASGGQTTTAIIIVRKQQPSPLLNSTYNGHYYELYDDILSWRDAEEYCKSLGGHLVTITSAKENDFVKSLAGKGNREYVYIGATDESTEGTWKWINGEAFSYSNFAEGEPSVNGYEMEDYIRLSASTGKWHDVKNVTDSIGVCGFICEYDYVAEPSLPEGADPDDYEKVTEYRYRDKQTTSSTSSSMSGWTLYDSKATYGTWSSTKTTNTKPTESDTLQITGTSTKYKYYHYWNYYGGCNCIDSISYGTNKGYCEIYLTYQMGAVSMADQGGKQAYGSYSCGNEGFNYWFYGGTVTTYSYQTRTKTTTNYFYKYGDWSAWSTNPVTATSNRQVETRTVYKLKDHKHKSSSWITDKKATVNAAGKKHKECTECGKVLETVTIAQLKCNKPNLSKISNTSKGVKISWGKVNGADKYRVYRKTSKTDWKYIGSASKTNYTDKTAKSGTKYYYAIKARNEAGNSSLSKSLSVRYLSVPKLSKVSNTTKGVKLTWGKVSGAEKYKIYRKTSKNGEWKYLDTTSKTYFTDKSAKSGKTYYYTARAFKDSAKSYYNTTGLKIKFLSTPKISSVKNTTTGIKITWNKISSAKGYIVYRKTNSSDWKQVGKVTSGKTVSFTDKKYNNNTTYEYTVRAYNGDYKSSYYSDKGKIKAVIKGDITSSNVKSVFLPVLRQISSADNNYYAVGLVKDKNGSVKDYRGKVPTDLPDGAVLGIYKFKSVKSISELKTYLKKYMTSSFIEENCYFDMLTEYNNSLYVIHGAVGSTTYNANSIKLVARHGNGYYISADSYGSGDNYCDTVTFYVKKVNGRYVVDDIVNKKQLHNWDYMPSNYNPIYN